MANLDKIRQEYKDLKFAREILDTRKTCDNCWYCRGGHCLMYSCDCVTQVFNGAENPVRWLSYEDGEARDSEK